MKYRENLRHTQYLAPSELTGILKRVESILMDYHSPRAGPTPTKVIQGSTSLRNELLSPGYRWKGSARAFSLREADGYHGGDFIGVSMQQVKRRWSWFGHSPRKVGVVTYEGGNGKLYGYAMFDLEDNSLATMDYEMPKKATNGANGDHSLKTLDDFVSKVQESRGKVPLKELRPNVDLRAHLRKKNFIRRTTRK